MVDAVNAPVRIPRLDLVAPRDLLLRTGWDATASNCLSEMAARLDRPPAGGIWTLIIDRAGCFRFTGTGRTQALDTGSVGQS